VSFGFAQIPKRWSSFSAAPDEYIDAGDEVVVRCVQHPLRPGWVNRVALSALFMLRNAKVVRGEFIGDTAKARDALGG